jgi:hypothetical protein
MAVSAWQKLQQLLKVSEETPEVQVPSFTQKILTLEAVARRRELPGGDRVHISIQLLMTWEMKSFPMMIFIKPHFNKRFLMRRDWWQSWLRCFQAAPFTTNETQPWEGCINKPTN